MKMASLSDLKTASGEDLKIDYYLLLLIYLLLTTEFYMIDESGLLKMDEARFDIHKYLTINKYVFMFIFSNYSSLLFSVSSFKPNLSGDADRFHQCLFWLMAG